MRRSNLMTKKRIVTGVAHTVPTDLRKALAADSAARAKWEDITPLARNEWICLTMSVKKAETRRQHVERVCSELKEGMRKALLLVGLSASLNYYSKKMNWLSLIIFIVVCELVGISGSFFTVRAIPTWYAKLKKPTFNPPNWIFGPVWTVLYALQGIAAYLVFQKNGIDFALEFFVVQLILNALWTPLFFARNNLVPHSKN